MAQPMHDRQQMSYWDVARVSKLPGASVTTTIDPSKWTVRMKNSVKRMLVSGVVSGGWSSVSARLAEGVAKQFGVSYLRDNSLRHVNAHAIEHDKRSRLSELVKADFMAYRMENTRIHDYYKVGYEKTLVALSRGSMAYSFHDKAFAKEAKAVIAEGLSEINQKAAQAACYAIDTGALFTFEVVNT